MSADAAGRGARKDDHVRLAGQQWEPGAAGPAGGRDAEFDELEFVHHALTGVSLERVDLGVELFGRHLAAPFYINGMTGGTERTARLNRELAAAAAQTGTAMACGSMSIALEDPAAARAFTVIREENPTGLVMANLGAGRSPDDARRAVDMLGADALQLHVNAVQETVMPEGAPALSEWLAGIEAIVAASEVPVLVKEVGFGLSPRTLAQLAGIGVEWADVSGRGGTDFLAIENERRPGRDFAYLTGFGQSAPAALLDAAAHRAEFPDLALLASGGVRSPLDVVRSLALGARAVGVAGAFLRAVVSGGAEELGGLIRAWRRQTAELAALLGAQGPDGLLRTDVLVRGRLREYCELRGIDARAYARRGA
ncbi:type 2 isopentenyl-diphosphate Delta-isomerase [Brevibacterium sp. 5221]|uniref:Isopentenyl-diphosphate delta-isomerase n=1 Tax=Brevibacterium rongguiense TaxID=2695267 RepID=A0A6N9H4B7_9MICO|nr:MULTISPECIES: type 2 isopentenyl-diphosphate Delta-isomerase [Brevibacterium]MYM18898.1 type 2 isopentenyl-diphosphate Delta-isomerase [Brevibacterium rongguiense]WAL39415.1 type 2 isopentenyl-diphosphate Delta-isomerase [Brevibacterium sp. BRM-1]